MPRATPSPPGLCRGQPRTTCRVLLPPPSPTTRSERPRLWVDRLLPALVILGGVANVIEPLAFEDGRRRDSRHRRLRISRNRTVAARPGGPPSCEIARIRPIGRDPPLARTPPLAAANTRAATSGSPDNRAGPLVSRSVADTSVRGRRRRRAGREGRQPDVRRCVSRCAVRAGRPHELRPVGAGVRDW
jgi:hypothetical protein